MKDVALRGLREIASVNPYKEAWTAGGYLPSLVIGGSSFRSLPWRYVHSACVSLARKYILGRISQFLKEENNLAVNVKTKPNQTPIQTAKPNEETPPEFVDFELDPKLEILKRELPPFPAKIIESNKSNLFFDWIRKLTEDDWSHLQGYLYREWPVIDRQRNNPTAAIYIDKLNLGFDLNSEDFLTRHGSGKYKVLINDVNKAVAGKGGTIGTARFEVNDPNRPPVFVLEELVPEHPSNRTIKDQLIAQGKLTIEGNLMATQQPSNDNGALIALLTRMIERQSQPPAPPKDATAESMTQMFVKANDTVLGMVRDQAKSDDPDKLVKLLSAFKEMMPKQENNSSNEMLTLIMKMQGDMAKVQADSQSAREGMMLKMMEMMNQKPSADDNFDKELDRMMKLKELIAGEGGGAREGKKSIPELAFEYGAPVVLKVLDTIQGFVNVKNYSEGLKRAGVAVPTQTPVANPSQPQVEAPMERENVVEMPKQATPQDQLIGIIKGPGGMLIIEALKRDESGANFAAGIHSMHGKLAYDQLAALGKEEILKAMQAVPQFWNQVVPTSVEKFVDEFIAYGTEEAEEEEE